jgi:hypothetical protein
MKVFLRKFNPDIVGKTGKLLPEGKKRDGTWWKRFEDLMISSLETLGHDVVAQVEHPFEEDRTNACAASIYVHKTRAEVPSGDFFYMQMHLKELFVLDINGWGVNHSKKISISDLEGVDCGLAEAFVDEIKARLLSTGDSKHQQSPETIWSRYSTTPEDFILAPLQVPRDYVIKHHSPISVQEYILLLSRWAKNNRRHIAFKLHPYNSKDYKLIFILLKQVLANKYVHIVGGNIQQLINKANAVVVINSGTGFEALIQNKPVGTFGDCDYKVATFHLDEELSGFEKYLAAYDSDSPGIASKMVFFYCFRHGFYLADGYLDKAKERLGLYLSTLSRIQNGK